MPSSLEIFSENKIAFKKCMLFLGLMKLTVWRRKSVFNDLIIVCEEFNQHGDVIIFGNRLIATLGKIFVVVLRMDFDEICWRSATFYHNWFFENISKVDGINAKPYWTFLRFQCVIKGSKVSRHLYWLVRLETRHS